MNNRIKLSNGLEMPLISYGIYQVTPEDAQDPGTT